MIILLYLCRRNLKTNEYETFYSIVFGGGDAD